MTKEQVKKYNDIEKEIQPLRALMELCGDKYRIKSLDSRWRMIIYTAKKTSASPLQRTELYRI